MDRTPDEIKESQAGNADLERLVRMTIRHRKFLWIAVAPLFFLGTCSALNLRPDEPRSDLVRPLVDVAIALALAVVAFSPRRAKNDPAARLLLENPRSIDKVIVQDLPTGAIALPGPTQIALGSGGAYVGLFNLESAKDFAEALDIVTARVPHAELEYRPFTGKSFVRQTFWRLF